MDQNSQNVVGSITHELLGLPKFALFLNSLDNLLEDAYIIFQKGVDNFEIQCRTKKCSFLGCSTP